MYFLFFTILKNLCEAKKFHVKRMLNLTKLNFFFLVTDMREMESNRTQSMPRKTKNIHMT